MEGEVGEGKEWKEKGGWKLEIIWSVDSQETVKSLQLLPPDGVF